MTATENGVSGSETAGAQEIVTVSYVQGWEELERLQLKTERVEVRQREHEKCQRLKREKIAMGNSTMQALLKDAKVQIFFLKFQYCEENIISFPKKWGFLTFEKRKKLNLPMTLPSEEEQRNTFLNNLECLVSFYIPQKIAFGSF